MSRRVFTAGVVAFGAWLIATVDFWSNNRALSRKASKVCAEVYRCYVVTETGSFSWDVLRDELRRIGELGAVWDGALYKLVEARRG